MKNSILKILVPTFGCVLLLLALGAAQKETSNDSGALQARVEALEKQLAALKGNAFAPELGDIMGTIQMRHAKLWFAGENENWALAAYELHEMQEGFEAVEKFHPTHAKTPQPLKQLIEVVVEPPLKQLAKTVESRNKENFRAVFDNVTVACNGCHTAAGVSFNVVKRPVSPPYSNQDFAPRL